MAKAVLISENSKLIDNIKTITSNSIFNVISIQNMSEIEEHIMSDDTDIMLFDAQMPDIISVLRNIKLQLQTKDIRSVIIFPENNINYDCLKYVNTYILSPIDENLFLSTMNSSLQLRETFRVLSKNNNDLAKSLYQLNVLYSTSTQLAGSLDKSNLIEIMTDGLDKSLSLSLCYALVLNEVNDIELIIKSLFPVSQRLEDAIKLRALLNFKNLFSINPSIEDIKVVKTSKDQYGEYDLNVFGYDNLLAPLNIKSKFYGIIEVFRETDFMPDDTKCFTTLVKQVSLPLESAILYEELKDTNIKLKNLEQLKSNFISIVSHELKTPLTSINSTVDIVLKGMTGEINDTMKKYLNIAKVNGDKLADMIKNLLDIQRIEAGKEQFNFGPANINLTIELVKNALELKAKEQNKNITLNLDETLGSVFVDISKMERVLNNLVSNAIKFTQENGNIEIISSKISADEIRNNPFFETMPAKMSKEYVQIAVKDNGIGIAPENKYKVFEQFKQIENSLSRKVGGSGLGLSIVKRLINAHKGFIWLESELNKGSTFYIAIPLMSEEEIFELLLENDIQKAKQDKKNIAITALRENMTGASLIDEIRNSDEKIIRKTSVYNEYITEKDGKRYYYIYSVDVDSIVFDFDVRKLDPYIKTKRQEHPEYDILYSAVLFPEQADNIGDIMTKINEFKGICDEENINS